MHAIYNDTENTYMYIHKNESKHSEIQSKDLLGLFICVCTIVAHNIARLPAKFRLHRFICRPLAAKNPSVYCFFGLRHLVMSSVGINLRKLSTGAQPQTFPYPTASKSFL